MRQQLPAGSHACYWSATDAAPHSVEGVSIFDVATNFGSHPSEQRTVAESQASACPQLWAITRTNTGINSPLDCDARRIVAQ
jgi:hypothetical protein